MASPSKCRSVDPSPRATDLGVPAVPLLTTGGIPRLATLALLTVLPSCLTNALWRDYAWPGPTPITTPLGESTVAFDGEVRASVPTQQHGVFWHGPNGDWCLVARRGDGTDIATTLLDGVDFVTLREVSIAAVRQFVNREIDRDEARVVLHGDVDRKAAVQRVDPSQLPRTTLDALAPTPAQTAFAAATSAPPMPELLRDAARRIHRLEPRWLAGTSAPTELVAYTLVGADHRTLLAPHEAEPAAELYRDAPLDQRLPLLRRASLLARLAHEGRTSYVRVRLDRLWLLAELHASERGFTQSSTWHLQRRPRLHSLPPLADAVTFPAHLQLREVQWQRSYQPTWFDGSLLARAALTPITLAADLVLGPQALGFFEWVTGGKLGPQPSRENGPGSR